MKLALSRIVSTAGECYPLGATVKAGGANFSVFSKNATGMELILFPTQEKNEIRIIPFDPERNKTYFYWHMFVPGVKDGQEYAFRAHGSSNPAQGLRYDGKKVLIDPYARAVTGWDVYDRDAACGAGDNLASCLRSVVVDAVEYDWEGDAPLGRSFAESVIYEMHVGGFTRHASSGVPEIKRGTFAGVVEKIPYLKELGVTAVELMPVQEFDPQDARDGLTNYWGYSTLAFMAPHHGYCMNGDAKSGINEFRDMVKALHKAGIEVILDVVFNHTAEGNELGPTLSFRGLDNPIYYILDPENQSRYQNFSGCGNSFNANHPVVGRLILDCLRYWVSEMHVDGFRFDLCAALARDVYGHPSALPSLLWTIESDPILAGTKLIAEAWDAAGLYRVGWFVNVSQWYAEWNGPFRDDVRRFIKGDENCVSSLATRLTGSSDIYVKADREPNRSINFVTCHDGFTLYDLVAYNQKHNELNGEDSRDGNDANFSWNCGFEGDTADESINRLRRQQIKNFLTVLFLSQGTPMLLMGDEFGRTQRGNNNAYCHDSEVTWSDWALVEKHHDLYRFTKQIIAFTQSLEIFKQRRPIASLETSGQPFISWHGVRLGQPDWTTTSHTLAFSLQHRSAGEHLHVIFNSHWQDLEFELPPAESGMNWHRVADTAMNTPDDICSIGDAPVVSSNKYCARAHSAVILMEG